MGNYSLPVPPAHPQRVFKVANNLIRVRTCNPGADVPTMWAQFTSDNTPDARRLEELFSVVLPYLFIGEYSIY
jgi:hypothetical protein